MVECFFVYILANCPRGVLYVGVTGSLAGRITVHKAKLAPGFTKNYGVVLLVHYEEYASYQVPLIKTRAPIRAIRWT